MAEGSTPVRGLWVGLETTLLYSTYLLLAKYLLGYFSAPWLLLASGLGIVLLLPALKRRLAVYRHWGWSHWQLLLVLGGLSGGYNLCFLLSAALLPVFVATMFDGIGSIALLPRVCLLERRRPNALEIWAMGLGIVGAVLVLQVHLHNYSVLGLLLGLLALGLDTCSVVLTGQVRNQFLASDLVLVKQFGKVAMALAVLPLLPQIPEVGKAPILLLWLLLLVSGALRIVESFVATRATFLLPPLVFKTITLLCLPLVAVAESLLFNTMLNPWQWLGVALIVVAGPLAVRSGERRLRPIGR